MDLIVLNLAVPASLSELLKVHASRCAEEVAVMLGVAHEAAEGMLKTAEAKGELRGVHTRNGRVWQER
ncbi:MAG TPA: hypothetical protein PKY96_07240 [Flavobacteriales bacterium]|nr:hypothetical protein [Flavobacteriales bacterium]